MTKEPRRRGLQPLGRLLHKYSDGEKVVVKLDPSAHKGMPHARYHGRVGVVEMKRGRAYVVRIGEGGKTRELMVRPEHLTPLQEG